MRAPLIAFRVPRKLQTPTMIDTTKPVRVFRNWKRGCYSIMQGGLVKASARAIRLHDVEFLVRESGRARMLRTNVKNVHAYAIGYLADFVAVDEARDLATCEQRLMYDAYRFDSFVDSDTHAPLAHADLVVFGELGATYTLDAIVEALPEAA